MGVQRKLHSTGQSLWMGRLSREMITSGSLPRCLEDFSISGLLFSPQALRKELSNGTTYDSAIAQKLENGCYGESLAYELIHEDGRYGADLVRATFERSDSVDGWVVIPVSPLSMSYDETLVATFKNITAQLQRPNVLLSFPAMPDRLKNIEELVYAGIPINITNVYSHHQYRVIAQACLRGIERRIDSGLKPSVSNFITFNVSRLENNLSQKMDRKTAVRLTVAVARKNYKTMRQLQSCPEWDRVCSTGGRPPRLVWNYSGISDMGAVNLATYSKLIAPFTVIALPSESIDEFILRTNPDEPLPIDGGDCDQVLTKSKMDGFDVDDEADKLQAEYIGWLTKEWAMLLESLARKSARVNQVELLNHG